MSNEVLYVLLPDFAGHEMVYLSQAIASDEFALKENPKYVNKIVAPSLEPIKSIGGFRLLPDYSFETMPDDYAALVLIGGFGWSTPIAEAVVPIVRQAIEKGRIVGAICNGASFLAKHGFLNDVKHTDNGLEQLKIWGGDKYTNPGGYVHAQASSDKNILLRPTARQRLNLRKNCFCCLITTPWNTSRCTINSTSGDFANYSNNYFQRKKYHEAVS